MQSTLSEASSLAEYPVYDVQVSEDSSTWTDRLLAALDRKGTRLGSTDRRISCFPMRARDWVDPIP
jgi:hypothetical protein